jgi:hypothetical protein
VRVERDPGPAFRVLERDSWPLCGPLLRKIWADALCLPGYRDLLESLATELSDFLGLTVDEAKGRMRRAWDDRAELARRGLPAVHNASALKAYYGCQEHGLYVSSEWHSLVPDSHALHSVAALRDCMQCAEGMSVFECGHEIGSTGLLFATHW